MEGQRQPQKTTNNLAGYTLAKRRLPSWIAGFEEYTNGYSSPAIFRKWGAISTLAGALERKVWCRTSMGTLYPNLYTVLCGPPATGKTLITSLVGRLWRELKGHFVAPTNFSRASLSDALKDAERKIVMPDRTPSIVTFNSLKIAIDELGALVPVYDYDLVNALTVLYDGGVFHDKKRSSNVDFVVPHPQLNFIAACTPSYLQGTLPPGAWDQGFTARLLIIFSGENILVDLFNILEVNSSILTDLTHDLQIIGSYYEKMEFHPAVIEAIRLWRKKGEPPKPDHPKLLHYCGRRTAQLLKLCMIACVDRGDDFIINLEDYQIAMNWLVEAEMYMPDIFKSMAGGGDAEAMNQIWYYACKVYTKSGKGLKEMQLVNFAHQLVPAHSVMRVLDVMLRAGMLTKELDLFVPKARKDLE
jgi:hypothetical protein